MELRHLRYFAAVAEYLNYNEASRRLHVAQPAISQTIIDLEDELGVKLFLRSKRSVQLTTAGAIFLQEAVEILRRGGEATRLAQRAARGEVGSLRIGYLGPAAFTFLPDLVQVYRRKYPDVEVHLQHMNPDEQLAAFDEKRIDLGLSRPLPPERRPFFVERRVYRDCLVVVLPGDHPLARKKKIRLEQLASQPLVQFHRSGAPSVYDEIVAACRRAGFSPRVVLEPSLLATVMTVVECGLGISIVPRCARDLAHSTAVFRPIADRYHPLDLCAAWPKGAESPTLAAFLDVLKDQEPAIRRRMERTCELG